MSQADRMESIEKFQRNEVDYLLATDLVARGLDINNVKSVLNFSFPTEPKRYLHRIGRTARAGNSGVAVTLCNDEERKDIKKLSRKLNQQVTPYILQQKAISQMHQFILETIDPLMHKVDLELTQDKEVLDAYKEAQRAENLIKYKAEILARPKAEWHSSKKQKKELQRESFKDLKNIRDKFDGSLKETQAPKKKREAKADAKKEQVFAKGASKFSRDLERDKRPTESKKKAVQDGKKRYQACEEPKRPFGAKQTTKSYKGKRNSPAGKAAGFRGDKSMKKHFRDGKKK